MIRILSFTVGLLLLLSIAIHIPFVQRKANRELTRFLKKKLQTEVSVDKISFFLPTYLQIEGVYVEDLQGDTLLSVSQLRAEWELLPLLYQEVSANLFLTDGIVAKLHRETPNGDFNFQFIIDAFSTGESSPTDSEQPAWEISVASITLSKIRSGFSDPTSGLFMDLDLGQLSLAIGSIDLEDQTIEVKEVTIREAFFGLELNQTDSTASSEASTPTDSTASDWEIQVDDLALEKVAFTLDLKDVPPTAEGIDFSHLSISDANLKGKDIFVVGTQVEALLENLSLKEKSGLVLESLSAHIFFSDTAMRVEELMLSTPQSKIQATASLSYPAPLLITEHPDQTNVTLEWESQLSGKELAWASPSLLDSLPVNLVVLQANSTVKASGTFEDLNLQQFEHQLQDSSYLRATGSLRHITDPEALDAAIDLDTAWLHKTDLNTLGVLAMLGEGVTLPKLSAFRASFNGGIKRFASQLDLFFPQGNLQTEFQLADSSGGVSSYEVLVRSNALDARQFLEGSTLGKLDLTVQLEGNGLTEETASIKASGKIKGLEYNQYTYQGIELESTISEKIIQISLISSDTNLQLTTEALVDITSDTIKAQAALEMIGVNPARLGFTEAVDSLVGKLTATVKLTGANYLEAFADIEYVSAAINEKVIDVGDADLLFKQDSTLTRIELNSQYADARFYGNKAFNELYNTFDTYVRHKFQPYGKRDSLRQISDTYFDLTAEVKDPQRVVSLFVPSVQQFAPFEVNSSFNNARDKFLFETNISEMMFDSLFIDNLRLYTSSDSANWAFSFGSQLVRNPGLEIYEPKISGQLVDDSLSVALQVLDSAARFKYYVGSQNVVTDSVLRFHLSPKSFLLNYQRWDVPPDNWISIYRDSLQVQNFSISHQGASFRVSKQEEDNSLNFDFERFKLSILSSIVVGTDSLPVSGVLNGNIKLANIQSEIAPSASLRIDTLTLYGGLLGDLRFELQQLERQKQLADVAISLKSERNDLSIMGQYSLAGNEPLDFEADIRAFELASLQPTLSDQLDTLSGILVGKLSLAGNFEQPRIDGNLEIQQAALKIDLFNSLFLAPQNQLTFQGNTIQFTDFSLKDERGNPASINGKVVMQDLATYGLDLNITSQEFQLLNSTEEESDLFYGDLFVDSDIQVTGTSSAPQVDAYVSLKEGSNLTVALPEEEITEVERKGVIEFVDKSKPQLLKEKGLEEGDTLNMATEFFGINLNSNVEINENAKLNVIIDQVAGDYLQVQGGGVLNYTLNPSGNMTLSGSYQIQDGFYELTFYELIKKKFAFQKGSTINWTGDPLSGNMDMTAIYRVKTAPLPLFSAEASGGNTGQFNRYKRKLDFEVLLKLNGELLKPKISFGLDMPQGERGSLSGVVYAKVKQLNSNESELNKQVFALLVLGGFIANEPVADDGSDDLISESARSSVSSLLSQQLNKLSSKYIKGIELDLEFESYEDYTDGGGEVRNQLQLELSKELLNERVTIEVGGNIGLDGSGQNQDLNSILGNIAIEYKLTEDGRYRLKGYQRNQYEGVLDGNLTTTGLSLIFTRNYNDLKELFKKERQKAQKTEKGPPVDEQQ